MGNTLETIMSIVGLLAGGGGIGGFIAWKYTKRKAAAEAKQAEAEASKAEADAAKEKQDYYQQIIEDVAKDRDYYKQERDEMRTRLDKTDEVVRDLQAQVARNGRMVESLRPLVCYKIGCKDRMRNGIEQN